MVEGYTSLIADVQADNAIALFKLFELLPLSSIASFLAVLLIITFFVTSSDSGSLVIDSLAAGGVSQTPVWQRVFWASIEGVVASALLLAGGLSALQTMTIASALPFAIIMLISALGMWRALVIEGHHETSLQAHMQGSRLASNAGPGLWKKRLAGLVSFPDREQVTGFMDTTVLKAMRRVQRELDGQDWQAEVQTDEAHSRIYLEVFKEDQVDFIYEIRAVGYAMPAFALAEGPDGDEQYYRAEVFLRRGGQHYDIYGYDQADIISDILDQFEKYLHFLHISPGSLPWKMDEHDEMLTDETPTKPDPTTP
jgi:choline/glycine/proline betaine transport protein